MKLSTIIVTWNSEGHIARCLASLIANGPSDNEIIVVDNASEDRTKMEVEQLSEHSTVRIHYFQNMANIGLGAATVQAYEQSTGDMILMANPDIVFTNLPRLLAFAAGHPLEGVFMPSLNQKHGSYKDARPWRKHPFLLGFAIGRELNRFWHVVDRYYLAGPRDSAAYGSRERDTHAYGASCLLLRRSAVEKMGGIYRSSYFLFYADADFGRRAEKAGVIGVHVPEASMEHLGGYSYKKATPKRISYLQGRGQARFEKDWGHYNRGFLLYFIDTVVLIILSKLRRTKNVLNRIVFLKGWLIEAS